MSGNLRTINLSLIILLSDKRESDFYRFFTREKYTLFNAVLKYHIMKKLFLTPLLLLATIPFMMTSCEKDKPLSEAIIGKWEETERTVVIYDNGVKTESHTVFLTQTTITYQFVEGGSGIFSEDTDDYIFSWLLNGSTLTIHNLYETDFISEAVIDGDTLFLTYEEVDDTDPSITYKIIITIKRVS